MDSSLISVCVAGCLRSPEREVYLEKTVLSLRKHLLEAEYLIALDSTPKEAADRAAAAYAFAAVISHDQGLGRSWNWGISNSSREFVMQMEEDWQCLHCWNGDKCDIEEKIETGMELCSGDPYMFLRFDNAILPKEVVNYEPGWTDAGVCSHTGRKLYLLNKCDPSKWQHGFNPYFYSNRPQIKHRSFHERVGWFMEKSNAVFHMRSGVDMRRELVPNTEFDMARKVIHNPYTKCAVYDYGTFAHIGEVQAR